MTVDQVIPSSNPSPNTGRIRQENTEKILAAAAHEFVQHGFRGASLQKIAERAELPKANVLYYFKSKQGLYSALLEDIIALWNSAFDHISEDDDPAEALASYIHAKVKYSFTHPMASRIFASEIIHGAPNLSAQLGKPLHDWVDGRTRVMQHWMEQGKMRQLDPLHLLFLIWSSTQFYADFGAQVDGLVPRPLDASEQQRIAEQLTDVILRGCGLHIE
ncbi:TetR/AcrR family transcriptional regulator [Salinispirillum sp. LH 10-3-1]|uniref:TetR/AcrR family transcriptional regulator n=1 Tax=Salinispirillum sp. LH 10-3-1 TaxID=2952525 RepID=A0AB38YEU7_9GAMM